MAYGLTALRTALVLFSTLGWIQAVSKRLRPEFAPGVVFTSIGSVVFFAGILNLLPETAWLLCIGGAALALLAIRKKESFRPLLCPGAVFFLACAGFMLYLLWGQRLTNYDNFTHWGVVTRQMLRTDRFPNFLDKFVMHSSYPLGSASFIYYFCYLTGQHGEWVQLLVQALLLTGLLTGLFAFARRPLTVALTAVAALFMLVNQGMYSNLLVDVLLSAAAAGGISLCIYYRDRLEQMLLWTIPYTVFLTAVKNSGLLFAVYIVIYLIIYVRKYPPALRRLALCALAPIATLLLWQKHVKLVFENGMAAKHSMSLTNLLTEGASKTPEDIKQITTLMLRTVFSPSNEFLWVLLMLAALFLLVRFVLRQPLRPFWHVAGLVVLSYAVYLLGTYLMYVFSMPSWEAVRLAEYPRYHMTILLYIMAILLVYAVECLEKLPFAGKKAAAAVAGAALLLAVCVQTLSPEVSYFRRADNSGELRHTYDALIEQNQIPSGMKYAIVTVEGLSDMGYRTYMTKYLLEPEDFTLFAPSYLQPRRGVLMLYDYLIVLDDTEQSRALMERFYGDADLRVVKLDSPA